MTNQQFKNMHQRLYDVPGTVVTPVGQGWNSSMLAGLGVGYKFNDWLRADVTGEYRGAASFHGSDNTSFSLGGGARGVGTDNYTASKSELLFLANAYVDLGTWWCITPYVGAGIGTSRVTISGFRDDGIALVPGSTVSTAYADDASKWNFAWALHAGLSYNVSKSMAIDFGYRYTDLGNGTTGATRAFDGSFSNGGPFTFNHITSHDFKLGIRWMLESPASVEPLTLPPLMRRG
jgi:opacity protein-like surface antigen